MKRSKIEKQQTHTHIVETATDQFRAKGMDNVGIVELMSSVGLTHGGFYAHFASKEALIAEACTSGLKQTLSKILAAVEQVPAGEKLQAMIDFYLRDIVRDDPTKGCVVATLAADVSHHSDEVRDTYTQAFRDFLACVTPLVSEDADQEQLNNTLVLLTGLIGTVILARAVNDIELSNHILDANRTFYKQRFVALSQYQDGQTNEEHGSAIE